ncbi:MAG TPA: AsmA-like C-terminal region-containing protein [Blastocatellia bacterium]|nr:AsmA-like C-terminal region-containing protein [Blastocatellia bacterium]
MRKWLVSGGVLLLVLTAGLILAGVRLKPMLRERLVTAIREQYRREVELKDLHISLAPFSAVGEGLVLYQRDRPGLPPLATVRKLTVEASLRGVLNEPLRIERVTLEGLKINVPPKRHDPDKAKEPKDDSPRFVIGEVIADGTTLQILPKKEGKEPLTFDVSRLTLDSAGTTGPMQFRATLTNAKPPGDIESTGRFGPWENDEPSLTPVSGSYTFQKADLSVFKGIAGVLSSEGRYQGILGRIEVDGTTDTPDFTVRVSGHPVHLKTQFHAVVDGTDGDTYLEPVSAQFGRSSLVARGGVYGRPGVKGRTVSLDVTVSGSRIEDLLRLAVKGDKPLMTGAIAFRAKFELPPGDRDIPEKLRLRGGFDVGAARFTSFNVQGKVDELSRRARGRAGDEAEDESAISNLSGRFVLDEGVISFSSLTFAVPGATVQLGGSYSLGGEELDFSGTLRTEARVSQMTTGIKSFFLRLADPLFKKHGAGAVIPIRISGTREEPKFGLDKGRIFSGK